MFTGSLTALVTPFRDGAVDAQRARRPGRGADRRRHATALVPCGSTGESATLTHEEHLTVVREVVRGRAQTRAGHRRHRLELDRGGDPRSRAARRKPAPTRALLISPYYNKPTQDGIYRHYAAVAEATTLPLIVYNIPGRTASNILARDDRPASRSSRTSSA